MEFLHHNIHSKKDIICINCGYSGHTSKNCNFPITSFGIITYKIIDKVIYYLMVQRKDTLCYTEFVRGKYDIKNIRYISKLLNNMTAFEQNKLLENDFDYCWNSMWVNNSNNMRKEYNNSSNKFRTLKGGYKIKTKNDIIEISLNMLIGTDCLRETEWEFPKGRRKVNEKDIHCALREYEEESGIHKNLLIVEDSYKQYEEIFVGSNNLRYRNIFYVASYTKDNIYDEFYDSKNNDQIKEVKDVKWFPYDIITEKIKTKVEKLELFKRIHTQISKTKNIA
jgi:8-oxo-dGTP pyrophosphatase MutT (NUDIX family)